MNIRNKPVILEWNTSEELCNLDILYFIRYCSFIFTTESNSERIFENWSTFAKVLPKARVACFV